MAALRTQSLGRNDPCHCGSGRKYKQCCLAKDEAAEREARVKAEAEAPVAPPDPLRPPPSATAGKGAARQNWRGGRHPNTRGFQKLNVPRKVGGG